jgi:integrase
METKARRILDKMKEFDFKIFRDKYEGVEVGQSLKGHFDAYIQELWSGGKVKTARNYECAINSLESFKAGMALTDVTIPMLNKYDAWMLEEGNTGTTISMYTRCLRTIINRAMAKAEPDFPRDAYPFGRHKYLIRNPRSKKEALSPAELSALIKYRTKDPEKLFARDMWLFSYYTGGRNPIDICKLKNSDISDTEITYLHRSKTARSAENQKPVIVAITPEIRAILNRWAVKGMDKSGYVFGILSGKMQPVQVTNAVEAFSKRINQGLAAVAADLQISTAPKMFHARSTMANNLLAAGVSDRVIGQIMGHSSVKTTELYLQSLQKEVVNTALSKLRIVKGKTA